MKTKNLLIGLVGVIFLFAQLATADNQPATNGAGQTFVTGTDTISSVEYPRVKMTWGADGSTNDAGVLTALPVTSTFDISSALAVTAGAYTAGYNIGGLQTLANAARVSAGGLTIQNMSLSDKGGKAKNVLAYIFKANPTGTTFTDNAALVVADADLPKWICTVRITEHQTQGTKSMSMASNAGCAVKLTTGTSLFVALVAGEAVTYAATGDLNLTTTVYQD